MKKQTAVDLLRDRLMKEFGFGYSDNIHDELKAIEKEQIIDAYFSAIKSTGEGWNGEYAQGNSPNIEETF